MGTSAVLGRLLYTVQVGATGVAVNNANVEVRKQGATVSGNQTPAAGVAINVNAIGAIRVNDTVAINTGAAVGQVTEISHLNKTIKIAGYAGNLNLLDDDRITVTASLPTLYNDARKGETIANPLVSDANGKVQAWAPGGTYDLYLSNGITPKLVQDVYVAWGRGLFYVDDSEWGIKGDGTDDLDAFQNLILAMQYAVTVNSQTIQGARAIMSREAYGLRDMLQLPNRISFRGQGARNTRFVPTGAFPVSTPVLLIGTTGTDNYDCGVEALGVDCNSIAGSIAIKTNRLNESARLRGLLLTRFVDKGLYMPSAAGVTEECLLMDLEFGHLGTSAIALDVEGGINNDFIHITCNSNDGVTQSTNPAMRFTNGYANRVIGVHVEDHDIGVNQNGGSLMIDGIVGNASCAVMVQIENVGAAASVIRGISPNGSPTIIKDLRPGGCGTITDAGNGGMGDGSIYIHTNNGNAGEKFVWSSSAAVTSRHVGHQRYKKNLLYRERQDVTGANIVTALPDGNFIRLSDAVAFNTILHTAADDGRPLFLKFNVAGTNVVTSGGNITLKEGNFSPRVGDFMILMGESAGWTEVVRSPVAQSNAFTGRETIASASTITLGATTAVVTLTGSTAIDKIAAAANYAGRTIVVRMAAAGGNFTLNDGGAAGVADEILTMSGANTVVAEPTVSSQGAWALLESNGVNWLLRATSHA